VPLVHEPKLGPPLEGGDLPLDVATQLLVGNIADEIFEPSQGASDTP